MNRKDMRDTVRVLLGETVEQGYKDTEINTMLNTAQLRVAIDTRALTTSTDITLVAYDGTFDDADDSRADGRYALPDDLLAMVDLELQDGPTKSWPSKVAIKELMRKYTTETGGKPYLYGVEFGATDQTAPTRGDIWFRPWPDKTYTATIRYIQRPSKMDDDLDYSELPEFSHMAVCYQAAMLLSRKWKERDLMMDMAALYREEMASVATMVHQEDMTGTVTIRNVYRRRR